jgi:hypothetical protein
MIKRTRRNICIESCLTFNEIRIRPRIATIPEEDSNLPYRQELAVSRRPEPVSIFGQEIKITKKDAEGGVDWLGPWAMLIGSPREPEKNRKRKD